MARISLTPEQRKINKDRANAAWQRQDWEKVKADPQRHEKRKREARERNRTHRIAAGLPVREILPPRMTPEGRFCSCCRQRLPVDEFYRSKKSADKISTICRTCSKERAKKSAAKYPERRREQRRDHLFRQYGISRQEFAALWENQEHRCKICSVEMELVQRGRKSCHIDHDHDTGKVRGLLCHSCNVGIGHFFDNPKKMTRAILYLEEAPLTKVWKRRK